MLCSHKCPVRILLGHCTWAPSVNMALEYRLLLYPQFAFHDSLLISKFNSFCRFLCLAKLGCLDHASILKLKCLDSQLQTKGINTPLFKIQHFFCCLGDTEKRYKEIQYYSSPWSVRHYFFAHWLTCMFWQCAVPENIQTSHIHTSHTEGVFSETPPAPLHDLPLVIPLTL